MCTDATAGMLRRRAQLTARWATMSGLAIWATVGSNVARSLRTAVVAGENLQARSDMLLASLSAALAFNPTRLGLAHALVMPIGANYKIPHSVGVAILLPEVMHYNLIGNLTAAAVTASS